MPGDPKFPPPPPPRESAPVFVFDEESQEELFDVESLGERWSDEDVKKLETLSREVFAKISPYGEKQDARVVEVFQELYPELSENGKLNISLAFIITNSKISRPSSVKVADLPLSISPKEYARILVSIAKKFSVHV
ncbi:hypothetical protein KKF59_03515 [Patescibacteria group bacterium]|nr:hypothetical protein [Patescibacteria group bacterium]MBU1908169.1 hypothetical protein [Patescibacteria group bacterium]